jgi:predicted amidophosphoribosyltransferase
VEVFKRDAGGRDNKAAPVYWPHAQPLAHALEFPARHLPGLRRLAIERPVCEACAARFQDEAPRCTACADRVHVDVPLCGACLTRPTPAALHACAAAVDYAYPWDGLIARFKFRQEPGWAGPFARRMLQAPQAGALLSSCNLLAPVPLTPARLAGAATTRPGSW